MTTELTVPESGSAISQCVADVADDLKLVAFDPTEMKAATSAMAVWFQQKMEISEADANELQESFSIAEKNGWKLDGLKRQLGIARKRVEFYEKCYAAANAGYCVVPNMPASLFAIRTTKLNPLKMTSTRSWDDRTQRSNSPPLGEGEFVDAAPVERSQVNFGRDDKGQQTKIYTYFADDFKDVEFPISICKPEVMSETARGMALKCFDEIAVCVGGSDSLTGQARQGDRQKRGDPLVLGIIRDPRRLSHLDKRITFLIGWYLDTKEL